MTTVSLKPKASCQDNPRLFFISLQESGLLSDEQLAQVKEQLAARDVRTISTQLLRRGWLNGYQLTRVLDGEGRGLTLGQYRVEEELGAGGFGQVYRAVHAIMGRAAAVKVISPKWARAPDGRQLFLREVSAATRMAHPNIALVYEANQTGDDLWFAMEYIDGPTLERFVAANGPLPVPLACALVQQVARALQCAHENGLVHRDVKPANLLLPHADRPPQGGAPGASEALVKVVDFGLARLAAPGAADGFSLAADGICVGTPEYMSPEQARNSHDVDIRSDLYSLGCVFYFALTGRPPFRGETEMETVALHLSGEAQPLAQLRSDVPAGVAAVVQRLMAKDPEDRFPTPADLVEALWFAAGPAVGPALSPPVPSREARGRDTTDALGGTAETPAPAAAPAAPPRDPAVKVTAAGLFREWLAVAASLARGEAPGWREDEYRSLYESLLAELHGTAPEARPPFYGRLEAIVEPWVSLRALASLDKKTLADLCGTGRRLAAELSPARRLPPLAWAGILALLAGLAYLLAGWAFGAR